MGIFGKSWEKMGKFGKVSLPLTVPLQHKSKNNH